MRILYTPIACIIAAIVVGLAIGLADLPRLSDGEAIGLLAVAVLFSGAVIGAAYEHDAGIRRGVFRRNPYRG